MRREQWEGGPGSEGGPVLDSAPLRYSTGTVPLTRSRLQVGGAEAPWVLP